MHEPYRGLSKLLALVLFLVMTAPAMAQPLYETSYTKVKVKKVGITMPSAHIFMSSGAFTGDTGWLDGAETGDSGYEMYGGGGRVRTMLANEYFIDLIYEYRSMDLHGEIGGAPTFHLASARVGLPLWVKTTKEMGKAEAGNRNVRSYVMGKPVARGFWLVPGVQAAWSSVELQGAPSVGLRYSKSSHAAAVEPVSGRTQAFFIKDWWFQTDLLFYLPDTSAGFDMELGISHVFSEGAWGGYASVVFEYLPGFADNVPEASDDVWDQYDTSALDGFPGGGALTYVGVRLGVQLCFDH